MTMTRRAALVFSAFFLSGISSFETLFAPRMQLWEKWLPFNDHSGAKVDHSAWDEFLARYVSTDEEGLNRVAYAAVSAEDGAALKRYIEGLASLPIRRYSRKEQLAYWINLYNALTVSLVLEYQPVESIRDIDISPGLFGNGPWDKPLVEVEGEPLTLNQIEHRILRPIWKDPRIHYAVNCAAVGCPNLQRRAFQASTVEAMLDSAAREFVNSPNATWLTRQGLAVSSIYVWFSEDFGKTDRAILEHLRIFADGPAKARLMGVEEIVDHGYDWRLNAAE